jgi:nucleoside-diphosphate-sugar epimerase
MQILVTGGAGYLGSIVSLLLLQAGHRVRVLDKLCFGGQSLLPLTIHDGFEFVSGDVCDESTVGKVLEGVEGVVHLAALVGDPACAQQPDLARATNLTASKNLVKRAGTAGVRRFVFASTCSNYGKMRDVSELATEEHELCPVSLYAETKVAAEQALLSTSNRHLAVTVLRFATLYGLSPRMRFDLTVNEFVMRLLVDRKLLVFGEQFWRPYVHVRDAAAAIVTVLEADIEKVEGRVFNVGDTRENYRKSDIVELAQKRTGAVEVEYVRRNEDPRDYRVSFEAIRTQLEFKISRRVSDGVNEIATAIQSGLLDNLQEARKYNTL